MSANSERHYDLIVVGSGLGSLATASLMASVGKKRVLVLESGRKLGGFLHTFRRGEYRWEPGVHYVSDMKPGLINRACMDLVTGGKAKWHQLSEPLDNVFFPDANFRLHADPKHNKRLLIDRFPAEEAGIVRYFKDMKRLRSWSQRWYISKQFPDKLASIVSSGRALAERNTKEYLDELFDDELLKAVLASQWPDFGSPPHESALAFHGIVASAFYTGGFYPIGGPDAIISGAVEQIEKFGGSCLRRHHVDEILIEDGKAYGVRATSRKGSADYTADRIVSGAGVRTTFENMVAPEWGQVERAKVRKAKPGKSTLILFLGLNDDPTKHGFEDCNYWMYRDTHHVPTVAAAGELPVIEGSYLTFGGPMRDPDSTTHVAQIVTFSDDVSWANFEGSEWKKRGSDYHAHKDKITELLLDFVEQYTPGVRELIAYSELSTPLTIKTFLGHPHGQIYGRACNHDRMGEGEFNVGTSIENLYLTGTDLVNPGIDSALMAGVMTASKLLGWVGMPRVVTKAFTTKYPDAQAA